MEAKEVAIQLAIADINSGRYTSQRAAAKAYNIPRTTLQARINGRPNNAASHAHQQRLNPQQEEFLVEWILEEEALGRPPSHARAREMATRILCMNGDQAPLGKLWVGHFIKRNLRVALIIGRKLEALRAEAATPAQVQAFLELFERTRLRLNIQLENIYNMDESGLSLGVCTNTQVLTGSQRKKAYVKSPENREWVTIIECIWHLPKSLFHQK